MGQLEDMEIFTQIVRANGITHAADRLNIAPSAVSRRLKEVEARLGVQLLNRTTRQISLTETGRAYLAHAERILADVEEANNEIACSGAELSGTIRITAPLTFGLAYMPDMLTEFAKDHPKVILDIDLADHRADLVQEGYDLAIRIGNLPDSSLRGKKICDITVVMAASPGFIERYGPFSKPEDLDGLPGLAYTGISTPTVWSYKGDDGTEGRVRIEPTMMSNNGELMRKAAVEGMGITRTTSFIAKDLLEQNKLVSLFPELDWGDAGLHLLWPPTRHLNARTRTLIDFLAERLSCRSELAREHRLQA